MEYQLKQPALIHALLLDGKGPHTLSDLITELTDGLTERIGRSAFFIFLAALSGVTGILVYLLKRKGWL